MVCACAAPRTSRRPWGPEVSWPGTTADCPFLVLCGGANTRLDVLQGTIYKPFLELRTTTLVAKHVTRAMRAGHRTVRVVVDEPDPIVMAYVERLRLESGADIRVTIVPGPAREKIAGTLAAEDGPDAAVVALGDTYAWYDPAALLERLDDGGPYCCIAVVPYRLPFGVVEVDSGAVRAFREKPQTPYLVNLGIMALHPKAVALLRSGVDVGDLLATLAADGRLAAVEVAGSFVNVDSLDGVAHAFGPQGSLTLSE